MLLTIFEWVSGWPLWLVHRLGAAAGRLTYALSGSYRRKMNISLQAAGYAQAATICSDAKAQAGRLVAELPFVWMNSDEVLFKHLQIDSSVLAVEAQTAHRPVIFLTPHLGAFEVAARQIATRRKITVLFKPSKHAALARVVEKSRGNSALITAPANFTGVRQLLKALKRGEAIGMLPDQVPTDGDGVMAPFFGRPAYTMTLPAKLAASSGAALVMVACVRLPEGKGWRLYMEQLDDQIVGAAEPAALNQALEALIRRFPDQYLWGYNRYKEPAKQATKSSGSLA